MVNKGRALKNNQESNVSLFSLFIFAFPFQVLHKLTYYTFQSISYFLANLKQAFFCINMSTFSIDNSKHQMHFLLRKKGYIHEAQKNHSQVCILKILKQNTWDCWLAPSCNNQNANQSNTAVDSEERARLFC